MRTEDGGQEDEEEEEEEEEEKEEEEEEELDKHAYLDATNLTPKVTSPSCRDEQHNKDADRTALQKPNGMEDGQGRVRPQRPHPLMNFIVAHESTNDR